MKAVAYDAKREVLHFELLDVTNVKAADAQHTRDVDGSHRHVVRRSSLLDESESAERSRCQPATPERQPRLTQTRTSETTSACSTCRVLPLQGSRLRIPGERDR